ncbi:hypothetical protein [Rhizobium leguminosarum]|uniref:hypothetical protein n=1 Tax=Rhizobium leguminosarum TaxID=384 RepID=UPI0015FAF9F3|nr:hypothetical protein [Rhizobium leguminosarum]MBA9031730.1 putative nucleic acid-binding Zn-ribbon protein [Rhizobium leguminosarum]
MGPTLRTLFSLSFLSVTAGLPASSLGMDFDIGATGTAWDFSSPIRERFPGIPGPVPRDPFPRNPFGPRPVPNVPGIPQPKAPTVEEMLRDKIRQYEQPGDLKEAFQRRQFIAPPQMDHISTLEKYIPSVRALPVLGLTGQLPAAPVLQPGLDDRFPELADGYLTATETYVRPYSYLVAKFWLAHEIEDALKGLRDTTQNLSNFYNALDPDDELMIRSFTIPDQGEKNWLPTYKSAVARLAMFIRNHGDIDALPCVLDCPGVASFKTEGHYLGPAFKLQAKDVKDDLPFWLLIMHPQLTSVIDKLLSEFDSRLIRDRATLAEDWKDLSAAHGTILAIAEGAKTLSSQNQSRIVNAAAKSKTVRTYKQATLSTLANTRDKSEKRRRETAAAKNKIAALDARITETKAAVEEARDVISGCEEQIASETNNQKTYELIERLAKAKQRYRDLRNQLASHRAERQTKSQQIGENRLIDARVSRIMLALNVTIKTHENNAAALDQEVATRTITVERLGTTVSTAVGLNDKLSKWVNESEQLLAPVD